MSKSKLEVDRSNGFTGEGAVEHMPAMATGKSEYTMAPCKAPY